MANPLEIIGPIMVGPSSSHIVGALRIAKAAALIANEFEKVNIILYGSFADTGKGHGTDKAILAGLHGYNADDSRIKHIYEILRKEKPKWKYTFKNMEAKYGMHPNTVRFQFFNKNNKIEIEGISVGGGEIKLTEIEGVKVSISLNKPTLVLKHEGEAETISKIMDEIVKYNINIYTIKSWMEDTREMPVSIIEFEQLINEKDIEKINNMKEVKWARFIETDWVGFA